MKIGQSKPFMFALIMFIIATLSAGTLTVVNQVVGPMIAEQQAKAYEQKFNTDFGTKTPSSTVEVNFEYSTGSVLKKFDMGSKGEAFTTSSTGRNGEIILLVNLKKDGSVLGIHFIKESETSGYASKVAAAINAQLALPGDVHYSFFAGTSAENGFGDTAGASLSSAGVRGGLRALYFCKQGGKC